MFRIQNTFRVCNPVTLNRFSLLLNHLLNPKTFPKSPEENHVFIISSYPHGLAHSILLLPGVEPHPTPPIPAHISKFSHLTRARGLNQVFLHNFGSVVGFNRFSKFLGIHLKSACHLKTKDTGWGGFKNLFPFFATTSGH